MKAKLLVLTIALVGIEKAISSHYEVIFERIEPAFGKEDKVVRGEGLRVRKYNRTTYVLDGKYEILMPIDDSFSASGTALNFQGNQYKKMFDKSVDPVCTVGYNESFREYFEEFQKFQKYPVPWKTCPYPAGPNEINNYFIKDYELMPAYIPGNEKWKIENRLIKDGEVVGGYNFYGLIRNQASLLNG